MAFYPMFLIKENKNAKALKVHSVIYWAIYTNGHLIFWRRKYVSNVLNRLIFFFGRSNLTISTVFSALINYFRFLQPYFDFWRQLFFMEVLTSTSHYMYIFMLVRSNAIILGYTFQLLHHFRFWRQIFDLNRFLTGGCSPNMLMTHNFVIRRSKPIRKALSHEK